MSNYVIHNKKSAGISPERKLELSRYRQKQINLGRRQLSKHVPQEFYPQLRQLLGDAELLETVLDFYSKALSNPSKYKKNITADYNVEPSLVKETKSKYETIPNIDLQPLFTRIDSIAREQKAANQTILRLSQQIDNYTKDNKIKSENIFEKNLPGEQTGITESENIFEKNLPSEQTGITESENSLSVSKPNLDLELISINKNENGDILIKSPDNEVNMTYIDKAILDYYGISRDLNISRTKAIKFLRDKSFSEFLDLKIQNSISEFNSQPSVRELARLATKAGFGIYNYKNNTAGKVDPRRIRRVLKLFKVAFYF